MKSSILILAIVCLIGSGGGSEPPVAKSIESNFKYSDDVVLPKVSANSVVALQPSHTKKEDAKTKDAKPTERWFNSTLPLNVYSVPAAAIRPAATSSGESRLSLLRGGLVLGATPTRERGILAPPDSELVVRPIKAFPKSTGTLAFAREMNAKGIRGLSLRDISLSPEAIRELRHWRCLQMIAMGGTQITRESLAALVDLPDLVHLHLAFEPTWETRSEIEEADLQVLKKLPKLEAFTFRGNPKTGRLTRRVISYLSGMHSLRWLNIRHLEGATDSDLIHLKQLKNLECLDMSLAIKGDGLKHLQGMTQLCELRLWGDSTDEGLAPIGQLTSLKSLELPRLNSDASLAPLKGLKNLTELEIGYHVMTGAGLAHLAGLPIKRLEFGEYPTPIRGEFFRLFANLPQLTRLRVGIKESKPHHVESINKLTLLEELEVVADNKETLTAMLTHMQKLKSLRSLRIASNDQNMALVADLPNLEKLELTGPLTDAGIRHLSRAKRLKELTLPAQGRSDYGDNDSSRWISDEGLRAIGNITTLESLIISNDNISGKGIAHLRNLPNLKTIRLSGCSSIDDEALRHLAEMPKLEILTITGFRLLKYGSRTPRFTEKGLATLAKSRSIKMLSVAGTNVDDNGIAALKSLQGLERLNIQASLYITPNAVEHLKQMKNLKCVSVGAGTFDIPGVYVVGPVGYFEE